MPYVKTGRPPGRPKTKEYVTLMARVPQDIADHVTRYKAVHRQTTSEVLRDALDMLLQDDRYRPFMSDTNTKQEILSDTIHTAPDIMSDMNSTQEILSDTIHLQRLRKIVVDMHEDAPEQEIMSDMNGAHPLLLDAAALDTRPVAPVAMAQQPALDYDPSKFVLGKLCPGKHDYQDTGQTLLTIGKRRCLACEAAKKREKRAAQRQAAPVA